MDPKESGLETHAGADGWLGRVSIRVKLTLAFGLILLLFLTTVLTTYDNYQKVGAARTEIVKSLKIILLVNEINALAYSQVAGERTGDLPTLSGAVPGLDRLAGYLAELGALIGVGDATGQARIDALRGAIEDLHTVRNSGAPVSAAETRVLESARLLQRDIQEYQQERLAEQEQVQAEQSSSLQFELIVMLVAGLAVGFFAMLYSNRRLSDPLVALSWQMREVAVGRTRIQIPGQGRGDEIGTVARALEVFRQARVAADVEAGNKARLLLELKAANSELESSSAELARASKYKSEFMATVSHELRTPLTSIRGSLGLVSGGAVGALTPEARKLLDIAQSNSERLLLLINDLLDVEKIESGKIELAHEPLDLAALVDSAVTANHGYAQKFKVRFDFSDKPSDRVTLIGDPRRLTQVVTNLLSNAAKYAPEGSAVTVRIEPRDGHVRVLVHDCGPGIPDDFRGRIFEKFSQADSSDRRQKGGTGLGLSICKAIIGQHGGRIGFESRPGSTTFWFELTLGRPSRRQSRARVLVMESDPDTSELLASLLRKNRYDPTIVPDTGAARRDMVKRSFDFVMLGRVPPGDDGAVLLNELRGTEPWGGLQVMMVSKRARDAQATLDRTLRLAGWGSRGAGRTPVLHVEDDPDLVALISNQFSHWAELKAVTGITSARELLTQQTFPLVILDLDLPDGSGYDLLPDLQHRSPSSNVVIFSAHDAKPYATRQIAGVLARGGGDRGVDLADLMRMVLGAGGGRP